MIRRIIEIPIPFTDLYFPIRSYGFVLMVGFFASLWIVRRKAFVENINLNKINYLLLVILISSIVGARLLFILEYYGDYSPYLSEIFEIYRGGLSLYGGLFAGTVAGILACRRLNLPSLKILDMIAVGGPVGFAFGRIGCFLNGCCYGDPAPGLAWAVTFPKLVDAQQNIIGSPPFVHHLKMGWVTSADTYSLPIHPTQLYEAMWGIMMFLILDAFYRYKKRDGEVAMLSLMLYTPMRFFFEILRDDSVPVFVGLTLSQVISILVLFVALYLFVYGRKILKASG